MTGSGNGNRKQEVSSTRVVKELLEYLTTNTRSSPSHGRQHLVYITAVYCFKYSEQTFLRRLAYVESDVLWEVCFAGVHLTT